MGIPKFAAWLTRKFPDIVSKQSPPLVHGLYIDMNGIIHPCCHSEDDPSVSLRTEDEKIEQVCYCVERLVEATRPSKVLYLAMDGVAPRAKMNQQRARRYMAAVDQYGVTYAPEEHGFSTEERNQAHQELEAARTSLQLGIHTDVSIRTEPSLGGGHDDAAALSPTSLGGMGSKSKSQEGLAAMFPDACGALLDDFKHAQPVSGRAAQQPHDDDPQRFDSNCISPGTEFMTKVARRVHTFVSERIASADVLWAGLTVVCSDTSTPGEGEHKLIDFIRSQTSYAHLDTKDMLFHPTPRGAPKEAHVICGLDADLILLCLSLHLENVFIMRDVKRQGTFTRRHVGMKPRRGTSAVDGPHDDDDVPAASADNDVHDLSTPAVQDGHLTPPKPKSYEYFHVDLIGDRIVSELRALCLATDFVVKIPTAFQNVASSNGYIVRGPPTEEICRRVCGNGRGGFAATAWSPCGTSLNFKLIDDFVAMASFMGNDFLPRVPSAFCGESAMDNFLEVYVRCVLPFGFLTEGKGELALRQLGRFLKGYARIESMLFRQQLIKEGQCTPEDGRGTSATNADAIYRKQYYTTTTIRSADISAACTAYIEGLRFVWQYYSCTSEYCSWSWYFPYHHAPFAADLADLLEYCRWDKKRLPAPPMEVNPPSTFAQLLCILPPSSRKLLPIGLHGVMCHPPQQLEDTFPSEWAVDYAGSNGKEHLAAVLLPFANMQGLQDEVERAEVGFTEDERLRMRNRKFHVCIQGAHACQPTLVGAPSLHGMSDLSVDEIVELRHYDYDPRIFEDLPIRVGKLMDVAPSADFRPRTYASTLAVSEVSSGTSAFEDGGASHTTVVVPNLRAGGRRRKQQRDPAPHAGSGSPRPAVLRGMPLGDFVLAVTIIMSSLTLFGPSGGAVCALEWVVLGVSSFALLTMLGAAQSNSPLAAGCRIRRNSTRDAFVDWLCGSCLSLNFMRNDRCFQCRAPPDDISTWAVFTGKIPQRPPPFDANHSLHIMWARIPPVGCVEETPLGEQQVSRELDETDENCEMI